MLDAMHRVLVRGGGVRRPKPRFALPPLPALPSPESVLAEEEARVRRYAVKSAAAANAGMAATFEALRAYHAREVDKWRAFVALQREHPL